MYLWGCCSLLLSQGTELGGGSEIICQTDIFSFCLEQTESMALWVLQVLWKANLPPSATAWTYFGKWRMINFWQRKTIPLASLAVCPSNMFILFLMPFLGLKALSTKVFWFPFCPGWQGLISTQGGCWVSKGEVSCLCPWLRSRALLPWLVGSTLWLHLFHLQDVEEEG